MNSGTKNVHCLEDEASDSFADSSEEADTDLIALSSTLNSISNPPTCNKKSQSEKLSVNSKSELLEHKYSKEKRNSTDKLCLGPAKKVRVEGSKHLTLPKLGTELVDPSYTSEYIDQVEESASDYSDEDENNYTAPEYLEEEFLNEIDSECTSYEQVEVEKNVTKHLKKDNSDVKKPNQLESNLIHKSNQVRSTTPHDPVKSWHSYGASPNKKSNEESFHIPSSHDQSSSIESTNKIADKLAELPVPANINQYGECLKSPIGRYNYGLTITDPPCQFFHGVLKGASGQTLAAIFGDINLINKLDSLPKEEIGHFVMDTSYNVISSSTVGVNHIFTINLLLQNQTIPLWFAITSCSSPELYKRILIEFQQHVLDWPFTSVLLNDDPDLYRGVLSVFPDIDYYGSWFYYCHSIWSEVTINSLVEECKANPTMMLAVKMLMVIPYLPSDAEYPAPLTMGEGFGVVKRFAEENNFPSRFHKVLDYVAIFWFGTVKTSNFTVYGKHTRSVNYVEEFQLALLSFIKQNGNVWTLTRSFQKVAKSACSEVNRFFNNKPFKTKKNKAKKYNVQIRDNMKKLMSGDLSVEEYLKKSTAYCEEILDIFLHPLYVCKVIEKHRYTHVSGWKIRIK